MAAARCACAHTEDPSPCDGPTDAVRVVDERGTSVSGCVQHGAVLLASLDGGRVYPGPCEEDGAAIDAYQRARDLPAFAFRQRGDRQ